MTEEQKQKYAELKKNYAGHCIESSKFMRNSENRELFKSLVALSRKKKELEDEIADLRESILEKMVSCKCSRAIDPDTKKQLTISRGQVRKDKVFDVEKFKEDYPDLYKKYCYSRYSRGPGGIMVLRNISEKALKFYSDEDMSMYFISEDKNVGEN